MNPKNCNLEELLLTWLLRESEELCIKLPVFKTDGLKLHSMSVVARSTLPEENLRIPMYVSIR